MFMETSSYRSCCANRASMGPCSNRSILKIDAVYCDGFRMDLQAVADMHFVNISTAYHPELLPRRQVLLHKACKSILKPSQYTASIFKML